MIDITLEKFKKIEKSAAIFGEWLKVFRIISGLTQGELSVISDVSENSIRLIENGFSGMKIENYIKIRTALEHRAILNGDHDLIRIIGSIVDDEIDIRIDDSRLANLREHYRSTRGDSSWGYYHFPNQIRTSIMTKELKHCIAELIVNSIL